MNRFFRSAFFPLLVIVLLVWLASQTLIPKSTKTDKGIRTYSELQNKIESTPTLFQGKDAGVLFNPSKRAIEARSKQRIVIRDPISNAPFPGNIVPANRISPQGQALHVKAGQHERRVQ